MVAKGLAPRGGQHQLSIMEFQVEPVQPEQDNGHDDKEDDQCDPDAAIVGLILVGGIHGAEIDRLVDVVRYWRDTFFACGVSAKTSTTSLRPSCPIVFSSKGGLMSEASYRLARSARPVPYPCRIAHGLAGLAEEAAVRLLSPVDPRFVASKLVA